MIDCIVLDIGEVLLRLDFGPLIRHFGFPESGGINGAMRVLNGWNLYDQFERGALTELLFCAELEKRMGRPFPPEEFQSVWNSIIVGEVPGVEKLVTELANRIPLYALSNTNETHMRHITKAYPWLGKFRKIFASNELGARKPERRIYELVSEAVGFPASRTLFIDDRLENVEGAAAAGFHAEVCESSPEGLAIILKRYGLLR